MSLEGVSDNPAGVFLALFAPVWLLVRRRGANFTERACLFFAILTFLYWGFMWAFIRYAIPMFFIFYALTAGRVVELRRQSGRMLRTAITAGLIACLLSSVTVTARYEINMPQLQYLAGGGCRSGSFCSERTASTHQSKSSAVSLVLASEPLA